MKRALAVASLALLAGCASNGHYGGYSPYGYADGYAPYYYYDGYRPYAYDSYAYPYYYVPGYVGGSLWWYDRDRDHRRGRDRDRDEGRDRDVPRAPGHRMDPNNQVRPGAGRIVPQSGYRSGEPTSGMTIEQSLGAAGR